jgi:hypothetical protein
MKFPLKYSLLGLTAVLGLVASLPERAIAQDWGVDTPEYMDDRFLYGPHLYGTPAGRSSDSIQNMTEEEYRAYQESNRGADTPSNDASVQGSGASVFGEADMLGRDANSNDSIPAQIASLYPMPDKDSLEQMFSVMLASFKQDVQAQGLPANDLPFLMSRFICTVYEVVQQQTVPASHYQAVEQQLNQVMANTPAFSQLSEAQKQDLYDRVAIQGLMIDLFVEQAKSNNDPELRAVAVELATRSLDDLLDIPASQLSVSEQGVSF